MSSIKSGFFIFPIIFISIKDVGNLEAIFKKILKVLRFLVFGNVVIVILYLQNCMQICQKEES